MDEELQKRLIYEFKLRIEQVINKNEFEQIYNRAKEIYEQSHQNLFLSPKEFAKTYLQLTDSSYKMIKGGYQNAKILKDYQVTSEDINNLRKKIVYENKLHREDMKTYKELMEYYDRYFIPFLEKDFFEKILDINPNNLKNINPNGKKSKEEKESKTAILKKLVITDEETEEFRNNVIELELLHKKDKINYEKFLEIYNKYFIPLSEEEFANKVLDINKKAYTKIKFYPESQAIVLTKVPFPENIDKIRKVVIKNERLHRKDEITYEQFIKILDNNYIPISREEFATYCLDISTTSLRSAQYDVKRKVGILNEENFPDESEIKEVRDKMINYYKLHKGDVITYSKFLEIYHNEAFFLPLTEDEYAKEMFDIESDSFLGIKGGYRENTSILKNEIVEENEIKQLRKQILTEFRIGEKITFEQLKCIYDNYYLRLSLKEYAEQVLDINKNSYKDIKNKKVIAKGYHQENLESKEKPMRTMIFLGDELENLKNTIIDSNNLYDGLEITRDYFMNLYKKYPHALSYMMFGKHILGINIYDTNALVLGRNRVATINTNQEKQNDENNRNKFLQNQDNEIERLLFKGMIPKEIAEELMISKYDIDEKVKFVIESKNLDSEKIKKERVRARLFSELRIYKIAIQLNLNIEEVKRIAKIVISEEIQKNMHKNGMTFEEALSNIKNQLLYYRGIGEQPKEISEKEERMNKKNLILTSKVKKVLEDYEGKKKQEDILREYINISKNKINEKKFDKNDIDTLERAILFLDDDNNIEFFARYCIEQREYKRARGFVAYYLNEYSLTPKERNRLRTLYNEIGIASDKSKIADLLFSKGRTKQEIADTTTGRITDVIKIDKEINNVTLENLIQEIL